MTVSNALLNEAEVIKDTNLDNQEQSGDEEKVE